MVSISSLCRKGLAACLAGLAVLQPALAASTDIADAPMAVTTRAAPNIMFVLDNSGSMSWTEMPDEVWCAQIGGTTHCYFNRRAYKSSSFNRLYYNPNVTYTVPVDSNGNSLGNANFFSAWNDGFDHSKGMVNLSTAFQAYNDSGFQDTPQPAYYCTYNGGAGTILTVPADDSIVSNDANFTCQTVPVAQRQNFANWYSYYRTRILAMKSAASLAFSGLDKRYRVGFYTINDNNGSTNTTGANFINVSDFTPSQKSTWFNRLFSITPNGWTPLQNALRQAGEYFRTGTLPGATGSVDPIQYSCQSNYTLLATDGYWNGTPPSVGNWDRTVPTLPATITSDPISGTPLTPGSQWPRPFYEGPTATNNTLADIAMSYWASDLRSSLTNNVLPNNQDPATWQHMVTFTMGLGVNGTLPFNQTTLTNLKNGTTDWPIPLQNTPTTIDDLWHAAVNGHGQYFSASDPAALQAGLVNALNNIVGREGSASAITVSNPYVTSSDNSAFISGYNSGAWYGELNAYAIDLTTGLPNTASPKWSQPAQTQLDALLWTNRKIATFDGSAGIPFTWSSLPASLQSRLHTPFSPPGTSDGATVLNFLRGDRSKENIDYRGRTHVLGDIINAEAVYVPPPRANYGDNGYSAFKSAQASRTKMLYQGANDGMLHAFNADTGAEMWAYVPGLLLNTNLSTSYPNTSSLVNLSLRTGFKHLNYIDATPVAGDVDFNNTSGSSSPTPDWHTILVGGLGKGGRGYYALDITNPSATSDADVAAKVLWEFPNASTPTCSNVNTGNGCRQNIGYSFGTPVIVKTQTKGWVVLVTSGYNNGSDTGGDGQGHLFVLDAKTGALIKDIRTGAGSSTDPSGLAHISAYVQNGDADATTDYVYGGDLAGNVWRFDLTGNVSTWNVKKLATLVDASGNPQPVTTPPELAELATLGKRVVYVGTGQYLGESDVPGATGANSHATQTQSLYALVDDQTNTPLINPLRSNLVQQTITVSGGTATVTTNNVNWNTKKGWFVDFPNSAATGTLGQRVIGAPFLALGTLVVTTNVPNTDPCQPGGSSWIYFFDYAFSSSVYGSTLSASAQPLGNALASRPTVIMLPNGKPKWLTQQSDQTQKGGDVPTGGSSSAKRRVMWREIVDQ